MPASLTLSDLAKWIDGDIVRGEADLVLSGMASLDQAGPDEASFLGNEKYHAQFLETKAGAVIVGRDVTDGPAETALIADCTWSALAVLPASKSWGTETWSATATTLAMPMMRDSFSTIQKVLRLSDMVPSFLPKCPSEGPLLAPAPQFPGTLIPDQRVARTCRS